VMLRRGPEAAMTVIRIRRRGFAHEADGADDRIRLGFEAEGPVPFIAACHCGEGLIAVVGEDALGREWPGEPGCEVTDNFPLGKELLDLRSIFDGQRTQEKTGGLELGHHLRDIGAQKSVGYRASCWL